MNAPNGLEKSKEDNAYKHVSGRKILAYKICKQICFFGIWLGMGLSSGINGPALPDLMRNLGVNYEQISRGLACESAGFCIGAVLGGVLFEIFYRHRDLLVFSCELLCATGMFLIPWTKALWQFGICFFLIGLSDGSQNSGVNAMVLQLWGKDAGAPMFFMHFGFGVGALIVPQIARPFLSEVEQGSETLIQANENASAIHGYSGAEGTIEMQPNLSNAYQRSVASLNHTYNDKTASNEGMVQLFYPYTIVGVINLLIALTFLMFYIKGTPTCLEYHPKRPFKLDMKRICKKPSFGKLNHCSLIMLVLFSLLFFQAMGGEHIYSNFLYSFATTTQVSLTKDQATNLTSTFWIMFMIGRFAGGLAELCVSTSIILFIDIIMLIMTSFLLVIFGHYSSLALWILTASLGFLIGPIFPAAMVLANRYLKVNSITTMVFILGCSAGLWTYVYFGGFMFNNFGPRSMMYFEVVCGLTLLIILIALTFVGKHVIARKKAGLLAETHQIAEKTVELNQCTNQHASH